MLIKMSMKNKKKFSLKRGKQRLNNWSVLPPNLINHHDDKYNGSTVDKHKGFMRRCFVHIYCYILVHVKWSLIQH